MYTNTGPINDDLILQQFVDKICKRISDQKPVRRSLPGGGRIHIDRSLPFICVYRKPVRRSDKGTEKLVKGEASYLIASSSKKNKGLLSMLIENIINLSSNEHKAFLIIEVWTTKEEKQNSQNHIGIFNPHIKIIVPKEKFHTETLEALEKSFETIYVQRQKLKAEIVYSRKTKPSNLSPLISSSFSKKMNCFIIGLEIKPFYQDINSKDYFPLVLRKFHQGFSKALKLGVYQFSHHRTSLRPTTYQALGRRALVKAVWEVDQKLAEINNLFDFLLLVTPINIDQSWNKFRKEKFDKVPLFYYRPIPVNPSLLKSKLYNIPLENIEDPTLITLFHEKQIELERSLSMLRDRGTRNFYYGSMQLYGDISNELISLAKEILFIIPLHQREEPHSKYFMQMILQKGQKRK
jgi:hypothetical protein